MGIADEEPKTPAPHPDEVDASAELEEGAAASGQVRAEQEDLARDKAEQAMHGDQ